MLEEEEEGGPFRFMRVAGDTPVDPVPRRKLIPTEWNCFVSEINRLRMRVRRELVFTSGNGELRTDLLVDS